MIKAEKMFLFPKKHHSSTPLLQYSVDDLMQTIDCNRKAVDWNSGVERL
jgi:hypothetical protein